MSGGAPIICYVQEPTFQSATGANIFPNLTVTPSVDFLTLTLSGTAVAGQTGTVSNVKTDVKYCTSSTTPDTCAATSAGNVPATLQPDFSGTTFTAINVVAGQQVLVTVTFSFS